MNQWPSTWKKARNRNTVMGAKVKVHIKNLSFFGEVIGVNDEGKLLLANHPEFCTLPLREIDLFRQENEVIFLTPRTNPTTQLI